MLIFQLNHSLKIQIQAADKYILNELLYIFIETKLNYLG